MSNGMLHATTSPNPVRLLELSNNRKEPCNQATCPGGSFSSEQHATPMLLSTNRRGHGRRPTCSALAEDKRLHADLSGLPLLLLSLFAWTSSSISSSFSKSTLKLRFRPFVFAIAHAARLNMTSFVLLGFALQAVAFPFALEDVQKRQVPSTELAQQLSKARTNCGNIPCLVFNEQEQYVSNQGDHAFASPGPDEIRGPCPGLNAAANHGYLSRTGVTNLLETITGLEAAFGMGPGLSGFLAAYAILMNGDPLLLTWSIGGAPPSNTLTSGLLGQAQGISNTHNTYESDMSIGRCDAYLNNGDAHSLDLDRFKQAFETGMSDDRYTLHGFASDFLQKGRQSISENPYFFSGPFAGVVVAPAAYFFVINLMSNHSAEEPSGYLNGDMFKEFFAVEGEYPSFKWNPGQERIPENWYRRTITNNYDIANADSDLAVQYAAYPESLRLGGNTNGVNTYTGVSLSDLSGGVLNAENLFDVDNPRGACFYAQLAQSLIPDAASTLLSVLSPVTKLVNDNILSVIGGMDCPIVDKFDQSLFNQFPGYKYSPTGPATNY